VNQSTRFYVQNSPPTWNVLDAVSFRLDANDHLIQALVSTWNTEQDAQREADRLNALTPWGNPTPNRGG
jgi:hypothetical protein